MVTDSAYEQYQTAEKQLEERQQEEKRKAEEAEKFGRRKDLPEEAKKTIAAGRAYLEEIKTCNDRIPGVEISEKISRLELVISKIFNRVERIRSWWMIWEDYGLLSSDDGEASESL